MELDVVVFVPHAGDEAVEAPVGRVDRGFAGEEKGVVEEAAEGAADEGGHHGDLEIVRKGYERQYWTLLTQK